MHLVEETGGLPATELTPIGLLGGLRVAGRWGELERHLAVGVSAFVASLASSKSPSTELTQVVNLGGRQQKVTGGALSWGMKFTFSHMVWDFQLLSRANRDAHKENLRGRGGG